MSYRRGKVYEADNPTTLNIDGPWYICTTAVILLQHGIDPNLYKIGDITLQMMRHNRFGRYVQTGDEKPCVLRETFLEAFLAAGYSLVDSEISRFDHLIEKSRSRELYEKYGTPAKLKHLCRTSIRRCILSVNNDTSIFSASDSL